MRTQLHISPKFRQDAFALIAVLAVLMLCAILIVVLMDRGTVGLQSSSVYRQTETAKNLADMALSRVQAQILDATTLNQTTGTTLANRDTWASQPGAIRVFRPDGALRSIYKLYSSDALQTENANLSSDVPGNWFGSPSLYTDLNEPVTVDGSLHYPILHPGAALEPGTALPLPDARGLTEGFAITDPPVESSSANQTPMPVRWIYVLQDGTLCQLGDSRIDRQSNPIVGRIAFWTDDETSKVNINTASPVTENAFWDVPRVGGSSEYNTYALQQPAQNEYQRYPGHPAMVSLRPILGNLGFTNAVNDKKTYFDFTPSYRWGGSEEGTINIQTSRTSLLTNKEDRSYATVDELLFRSVPSEQNARMAPERLDRLHFFLTAESRAPELNLFGQPRVTIWPVHEVNSSTRRTPYDQLIAFCSTVGGKRYYFTREDNMSPTHDFYGIDRNQELYAYLQRLTNVPVPGLPGTATFASKYDDDRDQILTQIFDYIRIVNLNETYQGKPSNFESYTANWNTVLGTTAPYPVGGPLRGAGFVVPIQIGNTRGMGRFPVLSDFGLWFVKHRRDPFAAYNSSSNAYELEALLALETITPAFGYMSWCGKNLRFQIESSTVKIRLENGVEHNLFSPGVTREIYYPPLVQRGRSMGGYDGAAYTAGIDRVIVGGTGHGVDPYPFISPAIPLEDVDREFSIVGGTIKINILIDADGSPQPEDIVQTYEIHFPDGSDIPMPVEDDAWDAAGFNNPTLNVNPKPWWVKRYDGIRGPLNGDVLHSVESANGDARLTAAWKEVPSEFFSSHENYGAPMQFAHGMRTLNVENNTVWKGSSSGSYVEEGSNITYFSGVVVSDGAHRTTATTRLPKIPSRIQSLRPIWSGDFDNGIGSFLDGPFINKPDEGMIQGTTSDKPYAHANWTLADGLFSPLRQVPSAIMFGSLPSGAKAKIPWRTLLFNPNPADPGHFGFTSPPDYLLLDLFRMPVVEPRAISGPVSTDGKINMNYAIAPFSYIRRASAMYAALTTLKTFSIPDGQAANYKNTSSQALNTNLFRKQVNIPQTLRQFDDRFAANDVFRSASEICSLFLVPAGETLENLEAWTSGSGGGGYWATHRLTGDNSRERPYAELYPKLTTQSNTYRVHLRVQALPPSDSVPVGKADFEPLAEYRGSRLIERYLDPNNPRFSSVDPDTDNLNELYQFRTLETRQFNP